MANEIFCLCWNAHQNSVWQAIESLLQSEILVDCTISAEGQAIKAHKIILCACSPYLESLLREHPDSHPIIILNGIPFSDLKNLTEFMYRGEISLKKKDLARFIKSAQALKIKGLSKELSEICSDLSTETKRNKSKADEDETRPSEKKKKNDGAEFKQPKVDSPNSECVDSDRDVAESLLVPKSELPSDPDQSEPERCTQSEEMEEYEPLPTNTSTSETEGPIPEENMEQTWEPEAGTSNGVNDTLPDISGGA